MCDTCDFCQRAPWEAGELRTAPDQQSCCSDCFDDHFPDALKPWHLLPTLDEAHDASILPGYAEWRAGL